MRRTTNKKNNDIKLQRQQLLDSINATKKEKDDLESIKAGLIVEIMDKKRDISIWKQKEDKLIKSIQDNTVINNNKLQEIQVNQKKLSHIHTNISKHNSELDECKVNNTKKIKELDLDYQTKQNKINHTLKVEQDKLERVKWWVKEAKQVLDLTNKEKWKIDDEMNIHRNEIKAIKVNVIRKNQECKDLIQNIQKCKEALKQQEQECKDMEKDIKRLKESQALETEKLEYIYKEIHKQDDILYKLKEKVDNAPNILKTNIIL